MWIPMCNDQGRSFLRLKNSLDCFIHPELAESVQCRRGLTMIIRTRNGEETVHLLHPNKVVLASLTGHALWQFLTILLSVHPRPHD
ncbi:hypothetical protein AG1IA_10291 [Rhizoctonia solani AG-1 IA]|uniref:Uncharacterized protein n=1 Tax=Thanatephorus cucumeris (strain AG1-IA) TaxID=983506 RepID=L8WH17_THACA|nr:hypothetical protein AG1IA_10291 [Rhizoctonia solani AG-1 IA]